MAIDPVCGMTVNEKTGLNIIYKGEKIYFCSPHCQAKFTKEHKIKHPPNTCESCAPGDPFYKNKVIQFGSLTAIVYVVSYFLPALAKLHSVLAMYLSMIAVPVLLGLLLGGVIDWLVPREYISYVLAGNKKRTIIYSVLMGFLMSACSHGILALSIQLYKKGASTSSVVAFLLASPWANLPITILMFGFFGWKALYIVGGALLVAISTGYIFLMLEKLHLVEHNPHTVKVSKGFSLGRDVQKRFKGMEISVARSVNAVVMIFQGSVSLANMVLWWLLLGALMSSFAGAFIPQHFMHQYMGASFVGMLVTLLLATVMEICSEGTAPLAFEIYRQTGAFGNTFAFLMAGVVTDYTEIGILWSNVGRRTAIMLPLVTVPQVLLLGVLFNVFIAN